jgi:hypothetical protein
VDRFNRAAQDLLFEELVNRRWPWRFQYEPMDGRVLLFEIRGPERSRHVSNVSRGALVPVQ